MALLHRVVNGREKSQHKVRICTNSTKSLLILANKHPTRQAKHNGGNSENHREIIHHKQTDLF